MITLAASIGRNIGTGAPMCPRRWDAFQRDTRDALSVAPVVFSSAYTGEGEWDGVREESAYVVVSLDLDHIDATPVRDALATLASRYGQEAIALSVSVPTFVPASV